MRLFPYIFRITFSIPSPPFALHDKMMPSKAIEHKAMSLVYAFLAGVVSKDEHDDIEFKRKAIETKITEQERKISHLSQLQTVSYHRTVLLTRACDRVRRFRAEQLPRMLLHKQKSPYNKP